MKFNSSILLLPLILVTFVLSGCNTYEKSQNKKAIEPLPAAIQKKMADMDMPVHSPVMIRLFKEEGIMEVWKRQNNGRYGRIAEYDICKWSGKLGPKFIEGDRQAPEGFYTVTAAQMNPNSRYYLSFNLGYPNAYDKAHSRTGSNLMVHGACSSAGCYSMTDKSVQQIYAFGRDAFIGGQRSFQVEAYPFKMTRENMARYRKDPNYPFWVMIKQGYDAFENTKVPPKVDVCDGLYVFNSPNGCSGKIALQSAFASTSTQNSELIDRAFEGTDLSALKSPSPSIQGREEAVLVSDWSKRRAAGQVVSTEPPSLVKTSKEKSGAPDIPTPVIRSQ